MPEPLKIEFEKDTPTPETEPTPTPKSAPKSPAITLEKSKMSEAELEDYTFGQALSEAGKNFGESWKQNIRDTIEGVKPENWKYIYALAGELAVLPVEGVTKGGAKLIDRLLFFGKFSERLDDIDPDTYPMLTLMKDDIIASYGSWKKFKNTLAKDPVRVTSDLMALVPVGVVVGGTLKGVKATARIAKTAKMMKQALDKLPAKGILKTGAKVAVDPGGTGIEVGLQKTVIDPLRMKAGLNPEAYDPEVAKQAGEFVGSRDDVPAGVMSNDPEVAWQEARQYAEGEMSKDPAKSRLSQEVRDRFEASRTAMTAEGGSQDALARQAYEMPTVESLRTELENTGQTNLLSRFDAETATEGLSGLSDELIAELELSDIAESQQFQNMMAHREKLAGIDPSDIEATGERILDAYEDRQRELSRTFRKTFDYKSEEAFANQPIDFDTDATTIFKKTDPDTETPETPIPDTLKAGTPERMIKGNWGGKYQGRYGIAELDDFIFSHYADGSENPLYPQRLQPRDRTDVSSQMQTQKMAREFDPDLALDDTSSMNDGTEIVKRAEDVYTPEELEQLGDEVRGKWVVLSGNGRMAAKQLASQIPQGQEKLGMYQSKLQANLQTFGLTDEAIEGKNAPVLFRELTTELDDDGIMQFVEEANDFSGKGSRSAEVAARDATRIDNDLLSLFEFGEETTLRAALKASRNKPFVDGFINKFSKDKQSLFYDKQGKQISDEGFGRIERAMLSAVYADEIGAILSGKLADVSEPGLVNIKKAIYASLPEMASMKALIEAGERAPELDITEDLARAVLKIDELGKEGTPASHALAQGTLGTDLGILDDDATRLYLIVERGKQAPGELRDFIKWYTAKVEGMPSTNQGSLLEDVEPVTKADILQQALGEQFDEMPDIEALQTEWREQADKRTETQEEMATEKRVNRIYALLPETIELLEEMEAENKLRPGKDLVRIRAEIDKMVETMEEGGDITLLNIDNARTSLMQDLKAGYRTGEITSFGSGSKADKIIQAMTNDMYTAFQNQIEKHPDLYPEDTVERIRTAKAEYFAAKYQEGLKGGAAEFLRSNQRNPRDIVNKLIRGQLKSSAIQDLYDILGEVGTSELRAGIVAKIFRDTNHNWTALKTYLDPQGKGINKDNPRRLVELLGGDATAEAISEKMNALADFKARFAIENFVVKGSKTAPLLNRIQGEAPQLIRQTLELGVMLHYSTGTPLVKAAAVSTAVSLMDEMYTQKLMKAFADSDTGRDWLLQGRKFVVDIPGTGKQLSFDYKDIANAIYRGTQIAGHQQRRATAREKKRSTPTYTPSPNWRNGYRNRIQREMQ